MNNELWLDLIKKDNNIQKFIPINLLYPTEKKQLEAVKQDGLNIRYINNPSEVVQLEAVKQDGLSICYIDNPSEVVQL